MKRLVLIKSCQANKDKQEACESTWVSSLRNSGTDVYFVEGGHCVIGLVNNLLLLACGDNYMSNSTKVREAINLLLHLSDFTHLFICDDDTFVHPARWLAHSPQGEFECLMTPEIPWCHGGGGWWMSRRCCVIYKHLVRQSCSWDDKLASEIIEAHNLPITVRPDLYSQWPADRVSPDNRLITCHKVEPPEMRALWKLLHADST